MITRMMTIPLFMAASYSSTIRSQTMSTMTRIVISTLIIA